MRIHYSSTIAVGLTAAFVFMACGRWHSAAVASPDRIPGFDRPTAVLLVQGRDCPDRRAAMTAWLRAVRRGSPWIPVHLGMVGNDMTPVGEGLEGLPLLAPKAVDQAVQAVRRSGLSGTPALLVLDELGRVLLADTFESAGAGPRLALAAKLLPRLHAASLHGESAAPDGR